MGGRFPNQTSAEKKKQLARDGSTTSWLETPERLTWYWHAGCRLREL